MSNLKEYVDKNSLFELIYPIGSIYLSAAAVNPTDLFGIGTWEKIEDTFLLASGAYAPLGSVGGNKNHTLTINEMPSHKHTQLGTYASGTTSPVRLTVQNDGNLVLYDGKNTALWSTKTSKEYDEYPYRTTSINQDGETGSLGGGQPFSIMPPYLSINVWKRVS